MNLLQWRGVRWALWGFLLLLGLLAIGRVVQVTLDSRLLGERGPYLQMPAPDGVTIRWQTREKTTGTVRYGLAADKLAMTRSGPEGTVHEIRLSGLKSDTGYYYRVAAEVHSFRTAPRPGSERSVRLWVQGDPGRAIPSTMQGRDAALRWAEQHPRKDLPPIDLWLTTGDNAYRSGKNREFQQHLFEAYPRLLPTVPYLPTHGNHDARRRTFYKLFTFPEQGELGGIPSGSEHYFSLDYGSVHLVYLDSHDGDLNRDGEMLKWLQQDLAATKQRWIIVLLHHPPYTKGSHDSDDRGDSGGRMQKVRENVVPLLEQGGVDLVLSGHSHVYERSHLMACHYDDSDSFQQNMAMVSMEGQYMKPLDKTAVAGTIYSVVGSSAYAEGANPNHPTMARSLNRTGALFLDISQDRLLARFLSSEGELLDQYQITKSAATTRASLPYCGKS